MHFVADHVADPELHRLGASHPHGVGIQTVAVSLSTLGCLHEKNGKGSVVYLKTDDMETP
jgi:hypothetical protein